MVASLRNKLLNFRILNYENYLKQASPRSTLSLARDDNQLKMCLLCTCESSVSYKAKHLP